MQFMAKMTKAERGRAASRRRRQKSIDFQTGLAETVGVVGGSFIAGRMNLVWRPLVGPVTVAGAIGLAGAAAKLMLPAADRVPLLAGLTSGMVAVGATEVFMLGAAQSGAGG